MPQLIWSPEALAYVQRLYRFLAEKSPDAARRAISAIRDGVQIIADHPDAGRPVDDMDPEFQEWPISFGASGYASLCLSRKTGLAMAFKLMMSAQGKWRKLDGRNRLPEIIEGVELRDGLRHVQIAA